MRCCEIKLDGEENREESFVKRQYMNTNACGFKRIELARALSHDMSKKIRGLDRISADVYAGFVREA